MSRYDDRKKLRAAMEPLVYELMLALKYAAANGTPGLLTLHHVLTDNLQGLQNNEGMLRSLRDDLCTLANFVPMSLDPALAILRVMLDTPGVRNYWCDSRDPVVDDCPGKAAQTLAEKLPEIRSMLGALSVPHGSDWLPRVIGTYHGRPIVATLRRVTKTQVKFDAEVDGKVVQFTTKRARGYPAVGTCGFDVDNWLANLAMRSLGYELCHDV